MLWAPLQGGCPAQDPAGPRGKQELPAQGLPAAGGPDSGSERQPGCPAVPGVRTQGSQSQFWGESTFGGRANHHALCVSRFSAVTTSCCPCHAWGLQTAVQWSPHPGKLGVETWVVASARGTSPLEEATYLPDKEGTCSEGKQFEGRHSRKQGKNKQRFGDLKQLSVRGNSEFCESRECWKMGLVWD